MSVHERQILFLRLEGPLQSWGDGSKWTVRDTRREPSKSGVVGLLSAALGWGLDAKWDNRISDLSKSLIMGVRVDRPGEIVRDYQTVSSSLKAEGGLKINASTKKPETVVSERFYLSDACYLVALAGPEDTLTQLEAALEDPVWPPFLGRKSCPPSAPIWPALPGQSSRRMFASLESGLRVFPWLGDRQEEITKPKMLRAIIEFEPEMPRPVGPIHTRWDVPLSFVNRRFAQRQIFETTFPLPKEV